MLRGDESYSDRRALSVSAPSTKHIRLPTRYSPASRRACGTHPIHCDVPAGSNCPEQHAFRTTGQCNFAEPNPSICRFRKPVNHSLVHPSGNNESPTAGGLIGPRRARALSARDASITNTSEADTPSRWPTPVSQRLRKHLFPLISMPPLWRDAISQSARPGYAPKAPREIAQEYSAMPTDFDVGQKDCLRISAFFSVKKKKTNDDLIAQQQRTC